MEYRVLFEKNAEKQLKKLDISQQRMLMAWIEKNLVNAENPRILGKPLKGNLKDYWRYRVGNYRIIADIDDSVVRVCIIEIGHRKDIYKERT